ncbi:MAG: cupin domain-containing protein [bacterium]
MNNRLANLRRVITTNVTGRSTVLIDGPPAASIQWGEDAGLFDIWADDGIQAIPEFLAADKQPKVVLEPPAGGVKVRWFSIAPDDPSKTTATLSREASEAFDEMGAGHARPDTSRHPGMHTTQTIDAIIVISGAVRLILDDAEALLMPGDVVIQRATNHAWAAIGDQPALMVAVLIDRPEQGVWS